MIKTKIRERFPHHTIKTYSQNLYIADYSHQTKNTSTKKAVIISTDDHSGIDAFTLHNPNAINIGSIIFDKKSFINDGKSQRQCECIHFPDVSDAKSWLLLLEMKYCNEEHARKNVLEAKQQLFLTHQHYLDSGIICKDNLCYLIVSLPQQNNTPFENFICRPNELQKWRREQRIIFRGVNQAHIIDERHVKV